MKNLIFVFAFLISVSVFGQSSNIEFRILNTSGEYEDIQIDSKTILSVWEDDYREYKTYISREKILYYENKVCSDNDFFLKHDRLSAAMRFRVVTAIEVINGTSNEFSEESARETLEYWISDGVYIRAALMKDHNWINILGAEIKNTVTFWFNFNTWTLASNDPTLASKNPLGLAIGYKTKLNFQEANEYGGVTLYILRRVFSFLPYAIILITILFTLFSIRNNQIIRKKKNNNL